jgi:hypothetical protein
MTTLVESDLEITLPAGAHGRKLDDPATHGLSHCMKAVDFVVELVDKIYFIELKDPDNPSATTERRAKFLLKLTSGTLDADLQRKFRDSFLYEWASNRADKPIVYVVLLGMAALSPADLLLRTESLKKQLPLSGPSGRAWPRPFVSGCAVMNLAAWNRQLGLMPVRRLSA